VIGATLVVTGVDGFVGRHLAQVAATVGMDVFGISRAREPDETLGRHLVGYAAADLRDEWPAAAPLDSPIVHLAGLAAVGPSFEHPQNYVAGNSAMVTNMCEALLAAGSKNTRIIGVSTGAVYAEKDADPARVESDPIGYTSPYVVSKVLVENLFSYYRRRGLDAVVARPFNHVGPGQGPGFLVPDLLSRLRQLRPGEALPVGNLATRRDYTDVRDVAQGYVTLATAPELSHEVYNVASGRALAGSEILELLCNAADLAVPPLRSDPSTFRASDPSAIVGNADRLRQETGWRPHIPITTTMRDIVAAGV
jgi:GDP-4-dehydro-6-deoxy-D-mannose reductase